MRYTHILIKKVSFLICFSLLTSFYSLAYANDPLLNAVAWQQKATEYQALSRTIFSSATKRLSEVHQWWQIVHDPKASAAQKQKAAHLLSPWTAMPANEHTKDTLDEPMAVILDIDETILNNSPYFVRRVRTKEGFTEANWNAWVNDRQATAIPGAVEFTQWADKNGIAVFYVSNRRLAEWDATVDNLRAQGFPLPTPERLLLVDESRGFSKNKTSRRQWIDNQYRVIALFGDSLGDFMYPSNKSEKVRTKQLATYDGWWGERWYALPNPIYGAWIDELTRDCASPATPPPSQEALQECLGDTLED